MTNRDSLCYGQQAVSTALTALSVAGHLRRVRCAVVGAGDETRWVFRTFWSRTARDNEWWNTYLATEKAARAAAPAPEAPALDTAPPPPRAPAEETPLPPAPEGPDTEQTPEPTAVPHQPRPRRPPPHGKHRLRTPRTAGSPPRRPLPPLPRNPLRLHGRRELAPPRRHRRRQGAHAQPPRPAQTRLSARRQAGCPYARCGTSRRCPGAGQSGCFQAAGEGFEVYAVTDASGGVSAESHDMAVRRMVQAGVVPITWPAVMGEWQRDWAREETIPGAAEVQAQHGGATGVAFAWETQLLAGSARSGV